MLTQARVRRWFYFCGLGAGAGGLLAYGVCLITPLRLGHSERSVVLGRGCLAVYWTTTSRGTPSDTALDPHKWSNRRWRWIPRWYEPEPLSNWNIAEFAVPLWMPVVLGLWCGYRLLPDRRPGNLCECGYDLEGVPRKDGRVVCPECGAKR